MLKFRLGRTRLPVCSSANKSFAAQNPFERWDCCAGNVGGGTRTVGVVRDVKMGRERLWQLEPARIDEAKRTLESIGREWELALARIKSFVEKND